jgi:hypothetical protein
LIGPVKTVQSDPSFNPIDPKIDSQVLVEIKNRQEFLPEEIDKLFFSTPIATDTVDVNLTDSP